MAAGPRAVVGRKGAYRGVHLAPGPFSVIDTAYWLEPRAGLDPVFSYYALLTVDINGMDSGSALPSLTRDHFYAVPLRLPSLAEQERIAGVLGAFDDLIEVNRRLATDLEQLAFTRCSALSISAPRIRFDELATRVVDRVKPSEWDAGSVYLGLEHFGVDGVGLIGQGSLSTVQSASLRFMEGDVLYGKLRPYFRKVARPGFPGVASAELWVLRANAGHSQALLHAVTQTPEFSAVAMAGNSGTKMPRADWDHIAKMQVPDLRGILTATEESALHELWETSQELRQEIADLTRQRDELLPLLMSGKVVVEPEGAPVP